MIRALLHRRAVAREARVLRAIQRAQKPPTGLEIARAARMTIAGLYPVLDRLETAGWITGEWGERDGDKPRRRYYRIAELTQGDACA